MFLDRQTLEEKIGARGLRARARAARADRPVARIRQQAEALGRAPQPAQRRGAPSRARRSTASSLELARARRMPFYQIEGVEEQIFTFDEFPMDSQVALLKHSLAHRARARRARRAHAGGLSRAATWRRSGGCARSSSRAIRSIAAHQAVMTKRVVHDRSVVMAFRMQRAAAPRRRLRRARRAAPLRREGRARAARARTATAPTGCSELIVVLISGRGSNMQALLDAGLPVAAVISNVADAKGLEIAAARGIADARRRAPALPDARGIRRRARRRDRALPAAPGRARRLHARARRRHSSSATASGCSTSILRCCPRFPGLRHARARACGGRQAARLHGAFRHRRARPRPDRDPGGGAGARGRHARERSRRGC